MNGKTRSTIQDVSLVSELPSGPPRFTMKEEEEFMVHIQIVEDEASSINKKMDQMIEKMKLIKNQMASIMDPLPTATPIFNQEDVRYYDYKHKIEMGTGQDENNFRKNPISTPSSSSSTLSPLAPLFDRRQPYRYPLASTPVVDEFNGAFRIKNIEMYEMERSPPFSFCSNGSRNFMAPMISEASKVTIASPRRNVFQERNAIINLVTDSIKFPNKEESMEVVIDDFRSKNEMGFCSQEVSDSVDDTDGSASENETQFVFAGIYAPIISSSMLKDQIHTPSLGIFAAWPLWASPLAWYQKRQENGSPLMFGLFDVLPMTDYLAVAKDGDAKFNAEEMKMGVSDGKWKMENVGNEAKQIEMVDVSEDVKEDDIGVLRIKMDVLEIEKEIGKEKSCASLSVLSSRRSSQANNRSAAMDISAIKNRKADENGTADSACTQANVHHMIVKLVIDGKKKPGVGWNSFVVGNKVANGGVGGFTTQKSMANQYGAVAPPAAGGSGMGLYGFASSGHHHLNSPLQSSIGSGYNNGYVGYGPQKESWILKRRGGGGRIRVPPSSSSQFDRVLSSPQWTSFDSAYFQAYSHVDIHEEMIKDHVRTDTYRRAIMRHINSISGKVVIDVGYGIGVLSIFCALAGAWFVYAMEARDIAVQAKEVVRANNLADRVVILHGRIEDVHIEGKVDVIISEWTGYMFLYESMLASVIFARDKQLLILPSSRSLPKPPWSYLKSSFCRTPSVTTSSRPSPKPPD